MENLRIICPNCHAQTDTYRAKNRRDRKPVKVIPIKEIIKYWGSGNYKRLNNNKFYEQKNLQLNILKSKKILKWSPKYSVKISVKKTVEWYKSVYFSKDIDVEKVTKNQINSYINQK